MATLPEPVDPSLERLRRKLAKRDVMRARVVKTAARLERRRHKLLGLEGEIAEMERRTSEPRLVTPHAGARLEGLRPALLVFNPTAGRDRSDSAARLAAVVTGLRAHGIEATIGLRTSGQAARELARDAVRASLPLVVVAGGDGTVSTVAAQLVSSQTALGIIPIGTMNNVARSLGVPAGVEEACALIGRGATRTIDMGRLYTGDPPQVESFMEVAGVGLSPIMALAAEGMGKRRWELLRRALRRGVDSGPGTLQITLDDRVLETRSPIVTVCNAPFMGSNLMVAPGARLDDGYLDVVLYDGLSEDSLIQHFMAASSKDPPRLQSYRSRFVRISAAEPVRANVDGAVASHSRVMDIEIAPRAVLVVAEVGAGLTAPVAAAPPGEQPAAHSNGSRADASHVAPASPNPTALLQSKTPSYNGSRESSR